MMKFPSSLRTLEVKKYAEIKKSGNILFLQALVVLAHRLGRDADLLVELQKNFIRDTLLWERADGSHADGRPRGYAGAATADQFERLVACLKDQLLLPDDFDDDYDVPVEDRLADLRFRALQGVNGERESVTVVEAIHRTLALARAKMNLPVPGRETLWLAQGVADETGELGPGECLVGNGQYVGPCLVFRSPMGHPGDLRRCTAARGSGVSLFVPRKARPRRSPRGAGGTTSTASSSSRSGASARSPTSAPAATSTATSTTS